MLDNRIGVSPVNLTTPGTFFSNYKTIINNVTFETSDINMMLIGPITVSGNSTTLAISGTGIFTII
jgi:hypothetical protein